MSVTGSNLTRPQPRLDEQSFQDLLAAAFTIQEHNDRRRLAQTPPREPEAVPEAEAKNVCPHCGAQKPTGASRCPTCSLDEFRPGERLQRNWASMWLMSQEQGWLEPAAEPIEATKKIGEVRPVRSPRDSARDGLAVPAPAKEIARETKAQSMPGNVHDVFEKPVFADPARDAFASVASNDTIASARPQSMPRELAQEAQGRVVEEDSTPNESASEVLGSEDLALEDPDLIAQVLQLSESEDSMHSGDADDNRSYWRRLTDFSVKISFHRANLYLAAAILVALLALMWPAATVPRRAVLRPWQRALITLGIAEAPAPVVHLQGGDPNIEVWVDPHTALYYCPGEEQYGKTPDGRFSSQREAQMERFDPAGRSACD